MKDEKRNSIQAQTEEQQCNLFYGVMERRWVGLGDKLAWAQAAWTQRIRRKTFRWTNKAGEEEEEGEDVEQMASVLWERAAPRVFHHLHFHCRPSGENLLLWPPSGL